MSVLSGLALGKRPQGSQMGEDTLGPAGVRWADQDGAGVDAGTGLLARPQGGWCVQLGSGVGAGGRPGAWRGVGVGQVSRIFRWVQRSKAVVLGF